MSSIGASLRTQGTVIYALFLRDMNSRYAGSRLGYIMAFVDPVVGIAMVAMVRYYIRGLHTRHGIPMVLFIVTGYLVWYAFRHTASELSKVVQQKSQMLMFPQVTMLDTIAARAILAWFTYMGVMITLSAGCIVFTGASWPREPALAMYAVIIGLWLGGACGILMGVSIRFIPVLNYVYIGVFRAGPFISGAIFTADELPRWLHPWLAVNPVFHACELIRMAWIPSYTSPIANMTFPLVCGLLLTIAALLAERATRAFKLS